MIPQHHDPTKKNRRAKAPYNFVPLPDKILIIEPPPKQDRYDPNLLTGKLICQITTASPIYVRAFRTLEEYAAKGPDGKPIQPVESAYGHTKEELIIPGSSLRGMLRTLVEIISYSRLAPVVNKRLFYRTVEEASVGLSYRKKVMRDPNQTPSEKVHAGFFHQQGGEFWIDPAMAGKVGLAVLDSTPGYSEIPHKQRQHREVFVRLDQRSYQNSAKFFEVEEFKLDKSNGLERGLQRGVLVITGRMPNKKHEHVFVPMTGAQRLYLDEKQVDDFQSEAQLTQYQEREFPAGEGRRRPGWLRDGDPVFYILDQSGKRVEAFGRAYLFRLPYKNTPKDMIPPELDPEEGFDLAEALFGRASTRDDPRDTIAGRVFIGDARHLRGGEDPVFPEPVTISTQALSTPKPTAIQHYLTQGYPDYSSKLFHYDSESPGVETTLRGHKLYWHESRKEGEPARLDRAMSPRPRKDGSEDPSDRNQFRPVKAGQSFEFTLFFENLRPFELGALLWVLEIASNPKYRLKIGMGKPYGLGSIAIQIKEACLTDRGERYKALVNGEDVWNEGFLEVVKRDSKLQQAQQDFSGLVLTDPEINPEKKKTLKDLPRIQELLALLTWENPPDSKTARYMELNEFSGRAGFDKRAVLARPTTVLSGAYPSHSPQPPPDNSTADEVLPRRSDEPDAISRRTEDIVSFFTAGSAEPEDAGKSTKGKTSRSAKPKRKKKRR
ncbi:MAG: TIGR03986 family CRISPR-associated RAMP protein [Anaerolineales bacterium]|nr:TIGR03986 family CRISPR-associated RAMP protein [Anaerolineales bacterium]